MKEEILRSINTQSTGSLFRYISRYMNQISIVQPVTSNPKISCLRIVAYTIIIHLIIIRSRHTFDNRKRIFLCRNNSYIHTSSIQHQRRHVRLERIGYIIPRPTISPINRVCHRHICSQCICDITDTALGNYIDQRIQVLVHEFRIETTY